MLFSKGYTFVGWDVDFSNITGDLTVTALYEPDYLDASVFAYVEKLNGNQNKLTITVTEHYFDGSTKDITQSFMINNNAAAKYDVSPYTVYVNTKGNDQIRECYIMP